MSSDAANDRLFQTARSEFARIAAFGRFAATRDGEIVLHAARHGWLGTDPARVLQDAANDALLGPGEDFVPGSVLRALSRRCG